MKLKEMTLWGMFSIILLTQGSEQQQEAVYPWREQCWLVTGGERGVMNLWTPEVSHAWKLLHCAREEQKQNLAILPQLLWLLGTGYLSQARKDFSSQSHGTKLAYEC